MFDFCRPAPGVSGWDEPGEAEQGKANGRRRDGVGRTIQAQVGRGESSLLLLAAVEIILIVCGLISVGPSVC